MKNIVKKILVCLGLRNPAKGVKITPQRKAEILLATKTPALDVFIETGTYQGDMIEALKTYFKEVYSMELDKKLYSAAVARFRGNPHVHIYHGDSAQTLPFILQNVTQPALIWLDAHAPGTITFHNSPIAAELRAIFHHPIKKHVVCIDDARHFHMSDIRKIKRIARANNYSCAIDEGILRLKPFYYA